MTGPISGLQHSGLAAMAHDTVIDKALVTPIAERFRLDLEKRYVAIDREKLTRWQLARASNRELEIIDCRGRRIDPGLGCVFEGQLRKIFWSFVTPCIEDAVQDSCDQLEAAFKSYTPAQIRDTFAHVEPLLIGFANRIYGRMVEVDRLMRGKGFPNSVEPYDPKREVGVARSLIAHKLGVLRAHSGVDHPITQRRLAAILALDAVGFSRLVQQDETGAIAALQRIRDETIRTEVTRLSGRIFKETGDGVLVEFGSVVNAVECGVAIQLAMRKRREDSPNPIEFRIGIHAGDIVVDGEDNQGDVVIVATRLERHAPTGGVLISEVVGTLVGGKINIRFVDNGEISLKNIEQQLRVWRWECNDPMNKAIEVEIANKGT